MTASLGIDVGSVTTCLAVISPDDEVIDSLYLRTKGEPVRVVKEGIRILGERRPGLIVGAVGTTGSARALTGAVVGADVVKNEITAHAVGASRYVPGVQTIIEIGGQDSKIILLQDGVVIDFAMNTVCAAGTGSFLDHQAARLGIPIEEFGEVALQSRSPVRIAGRCSVFAESDMIHKQQAGHPLPDIVAGLCDALVRNYLNNVAKGKEIRPPVAFQGGVAANAGIRAAFERELGIQVIVPEQFSVMGAIGAALIARRELNGKRTGFRGFGLCELDYQPSSFECQGCPNRCEVIDIHVGSDLVARWGGRCGKWDQLENNSPSRHCQ